MRQVQAVAAEARAVARTVAACPHVRRHVTTVLCELLRRAGLPTLQQQVQAAAAASAHAARSARAAGKARASRQAAKGYSSG